MWYVSGFVCTTLEECENEGFTLKTYQMFSSTLRQRNSKKQHHRSFWICVWGKLVQGYHTIIATSSSSNSSNFRFQNVSSLRKNAKPAFSNFSGLKGVFENLRFRVGLVWTVARPNRRNKAPFLNFSGIVGTGPKLIQNRCTLHSPAN